jgi:hypothetical protein
VDAVTGIHQSIAAGALLLALLAGTSVEWQSERAAPNARFWFDGVTFELPRPTPLIPTHITAKEAREIERVARAELSQAFAPFRITFSDHPRARYQVRVVQQFPPRTGPQRLAAAESIALGPLGGYGWVSFASLTSLALGHAPAGADRARVVESIGRGIGRVAAHEFAHQILTTADLHRSRDRESYEYASADRATQFYGPMAWDFAAPLLIEKLSPASD